MQRNFNTFDLPEDISPEQVIPTEDGLKIIWSHDSHMSFYTWDFLEPYIKQGRPDDEVIPLTYFGAGGYPDSTIEYSEFRKDVTRAVGLLTNKIWHGGYASVVGVPTDSAKPTEDLLRTISLIRPTHYGEFYDFIPDQALADTAYSNVALGAHTDCTYFSEPPGIQTFHLLSHTGGDGGLSLLVDGFHAAAKLKEEDPDSYDILTRFPIHSHASGNKGIAIAPDQPYPVIQHIQRKAVPHRIRWNPDDRGVIPLGCKTSEMEWYKAARKWNEILKRKDMEYWFQLEPGRVLLFNNWRVLHGRSAFTGLRRMCGAYFFHDDFVSKWRNTNYPRNEVLRRVNG
ncbi:hypothetical protein F4803DRAFT_550921 [Xylaria telfairii]|nr:hypothetical protein F4803DRAFT_550921 [Xylaria telfairii]